MSGKKSAVPKPLAAAASSAPDAMSFDELMAMHKKAEAFLESIEAIITKKYPTRVPKCGYCQVPFQKGWHCGGCGGV